jgi:hypothetical protein
MYSSLPGAAGASLRRQRAHRVHPASSLLRARAEQGKAEQRRSPTIERDRASASAAAAAVGPPAVAGAVRQLHCVRPQAPPDAGACHRHQPSACVRNVREGCCTQPLGQAIGAPDVDLEHVGGRLGHCSGAAGARAAAVSRHALEATFQRCGGGGGAGAQHAAVLPAQQPHQRAAWLAAAAGCTSCRCTRAARPALAPGWQLAPSRG